MKIYLPLLVVLAFMLAACGDSDSDKDDNGGPPVTGNTVNGMAFKGPFTAGTVTAFAIESNGTLGAQLGSGSIAGDGTFSLDVGSHVGPLMLRARGGTYLDEATGNTAQTADLYSALAGTAALNVANITPLTSIVASRALRRISLGENAADAIAGAEMKVSNWFGISDLRAAIPADLAGGPVSTVDNSAEYGAILAGISQLALDLSVGADELTEALAADAADGDFDGEDGGVPVMLGASALSSAAAQTELADAIVDFLASSANNSGLTDTDFGDLIDRLNSRPDPLLFVMSISVSPQNQTVPANANVVYSAQGSFSDGSVDNITTSVVWSSSDTAIATISPTGVATAGTQAGSTDIIAERDGAQGSTQLHVTGATLVSIEVLPAAPTLLVNDTQQFTAMGTYSDSSVIDITAIVDWDSSNTGVLTINTSGFATAVSDGTSTVTATDPQTSIDGSTLVTVDPLPVLVSITVTPANPTMHITQTQQFTAMGTYSDSNVVDITASVNWSSSNPAALNINASGFATAEAAGAVTVTATDPATSVSGNTGATVFVSYSVNIQPIFNAHCISCHGNPPQNGLDLRTYAGVMAGAIGFGGPVVTPSNSQTSTLWLRVEGLIQPQMPDGAPPLPSSQRNMIRDWIDEGALDN
jgi:trimeric autotransporter adhesin